MPGKGRGRGFIPRGGRDSRCRRGALSPSTGADRGPISGMGSADWCRAPLAADGAEKRKSDVISPLLPVDGVGEVKRREPGRARIAGAGLVASVVGDGLDMGLNASAGVGVTPISSMLVGGSVPGFQGPLFWSNPEGLLNMRFDDISSPPYIVLLESRIPGKNLGRFNLIALGDLVDSLIPDTKRQIFPNGRNQAKIFCDGWRAANVLVEFSALQEFGVHAYIPASLVQKRAFARSIPVEYTASDLSTRLDPDTLASVLSIRRRNLDDGSASDRVEFVFSTINIPQRISIASVAFDLTL